MHNNLQSLFSFPTPKPQYFKNKKKHFYLLFIAALTQHTPTAQVLLTHIF